MARRKPKKGYVYLLQSTIDRSSFKFGCTSLTPERRCSAINHKHQGSKFEVVARFQSLDIFKDECDVKGDLLPYGYGFISEFFDISEFDEEDRLKVGGVFGVVGRFISIGNKANAKARVGV